MVSCNNIFSRNLGFKAYELKDHLGNVRVTFSDVKIPNGTSFLADMITKNEYYSFGMLIDGQSVSPSNYRYSFNTQEISTEINQNRTTAEFWEYDSRSGRRWNLDPIDQISISNYATFFNNPISFSDHLGLTGENANPLHPDPDGDSGGGLTVSANGPTSGNYPGSTVPADNTSTQINIKEVYQPPISKEISEKMYWDKMPPIPEVPYAPDAIENNSMDLVMLGWGVRDATRLTAAGWNVLIKGSQSSVKVINVKSKITVLGKYPEYLNMATNFNANRFSIPSNIWNKMTAIEQSAANMKFLDRAIKRGDKFYLSNKVEKIDNVSGAFREELEYLISKGYKLSKDGWSLYK